jgi:U3 small nucleolar RNA-associated protein 12
MAKSYYAFESSGRFGDISGAAGVVFSEDDKCLISAGTSALSIWNIRKTSLIRKFTFTDTITCIEYNKSLAIGFKDGHISIHTLENVLCNTFEGHESSISALCFSIDSLTLYSGSYDTTIIIWDLVGDCALKRLQGHRDSITCLYISDTLYSCSRDKMIKQWEFDMCVNTFICPGEVWGITKHDNKIYASCDKFIRVYERTQEVGLIERSDANRCKKISIKFGLIVTCSKSKLEVWRIRGQKEIEKKLKRRRKRNRDKDLVLQFPDYYEKIVSHKSVEKISGFDVSNKQYKSSTHETQIFVTLSYSSNSLRVYSLHFNSKSSLKTSAEFNSVGNIDHEGHRSPARTLALSKDNNNLASGSGESLKVWNLNTRQCIVNIESGYCLCSAWFPGDKFVIIGCKSGELQLFDVLTSEKVLTKEAHEGSVWACDISDQTLVTGGTDYILKWWSLQLSPLKLKSYDSITLKDEILALKFTPCKKFICAALLDSTIQVLYSDTKKVLFSLYAHKLPVVAFDVSYDSMLLVSGSSDKNLKVWGMDYGDCHKSIIAHSQPITDVKFVPETHFCFSSGRDFLIKYWDMDTKELIQVLKGHTSEVWSICISVQGDFLISTGNDYTFHIWVQTDTQLFLSEQKEIEIENNTKLEDLGIQKSQKESVLLTHASAEALKSGEALIEALEVCSQYRDHIKNGGNSLAPPHFGGKDEYSYILKNLTLIPSQYLDSVMHILPYNYAIDLFKYLEHYLDTNTDIEIVSKSIILLLKVHENSLISSIFGNEHWYVLLDRLKDKLQQKTKQYKDLIGRNIAAAKIVLKDII